MSEAPYTPFQGRLINVVPPMRVLRRFTKPGGGVAELRERVVTTFRAIEWMAFIDGSLTESRLYHGAREPFYLAELEERVTAMLEDGWIEDVASRSDSGYGQRSN